MSDGQMENGQGKKNERSAIRGGGWKKKKKKESENTRSMQPGRGSHFVVGQFSLWLLKGCIMLHSVSALPEQAPGGMRQGVAS